MSTNKYIEFYSKTQEFHSQKSNRMLEEGIKDAGSDNTFAPSLIDYCPLSIAEFLFSKKQ